MLPSKAGNPMRLQCIVQPYQQASGVQPKPQIKTQQDSNCGSNLAAMQTVRHQKATACHHHLQPGPHQVLGMCSGHTQQNPHTHLHNMMVCHTSRHARMQGQQPDHHCCLLCCSVCMQEPKGPDRMQTGNEDTHWLDEATCGPPGVALATDSSCRIQAS